MPLAAEALLENMRAVVRDMTSKYGGKEQFKVPVQTTMYELSVGDPVVENIKTLDAKSIEALLH